MALRGHPARVRRTRPKLTEQTRKQELRRLQTEPVSRVTPSAARPSNHPRADQPVSRDDLADSFNGDP